jgi:hypothetical protein
MSGDQRGNAPWGDAFAPKDVGTGNAKKTIWVELGPVWMGEKGALSFTLQVEPLHWREYSEERRIVIRQRETEQQRNDRQSRDRDNSSRGGNRR